jgi:hypothetical protein
MSDDLSNASTPIAEASAPVVVAAAKSRNKPSKKKTIMTVRQLAAALGKSESAVRTQKLRPDWHFTPPYPVEEIKRWWKRRPLVVENVPPLSASTLFFNEKKKTWLCRHLVISNPPRPFKIPKTVPKKFRRFQFPGITISRWVAEGRLTGRILPVEGQVQVRQFLDYSELCELEEDRAAPPAADPDYMDVAEFLGLGLCRQIWTLNTDSDDARRKVPLQPHPLFDHPFHTKWGERISGKRNRRWAKPRLISRAEVAELLEKIKSFHPPPGTEFTEDAARRRGDVRPNTIVNWIRTKKVVGESILAPKPNGICMRRWVVNVESLARIPLMSRPGKQPREWRRHDGYGFMPVCDAGRLLGVDAGTIRHYCVFDHKQLGRPIQFTHAPLWLYATKAREKALVVFWDDIFCIRDRMDGKATAVPPLLPVQTALPPTLIDQLNDREIQLLRAMYKLDAFSRSSARKLEEIVWIARKNEVTWESFKKVLSKLVKLGLAKSADVRGSGGAWLTPMGRKVAESI